MKSKYWPALMVASLAMAASAEPAHQGHSPDQRPLNVLLVVSDDQQHSALGCAGNPVVQTPYLDRLASTGVRFTHAFVDVPICTPSRAAFLTGRSAACNGVPFFGKPLLPNTPTWAGTLAGHGYQTALVGKWHNAPEFDQWGFQWSANVFMAGMGTYLNPKLIQHAGDEPKVVQGEITQLITDAAVKYLDERDAARPFFLYVAYTAPHDPRTPPARYAAMYDPEKMPLPSNFKPVPQPDPGTLGIRDEKLLPVPRDPAAVRGEIAKYYGLITYLDAEIGRLLETLERKGLADNTIVFFAGDNGLALGAHGLLGKQTLHEEGVRVPVIVRHPRLGQAGQTRDALVYLADLMPTACEWTNTPIPAGLQGRSLGGIYAGKESAVRDAVFGRYDEGDEQLFRSVRTDRYKLIQYLKLDREQLFDLKDDPFELTDRIGDPALQKTHDQLHDRLMAWRAEQDKIETSWRKPPATRNAKGNNR